MRAMNLILVGLFAASCNYFTGEDQPLQYPLRSNLSKELRLNGYYIDEPSSEKDITVTPLFLYSNGVLYRPFSLYRDRLPTFAEVLADSVELRARSEFKYIWGHYWIKGDTLISEAWHPSGGFSSDVLIEKSIILNDSTFRIETIERPDGSLKVRSGELYRFKKFSPKPDSICPFIPESDPNYKPPDK